jgi:hypothetical protein
MRTQTILLLICATLMPYPAFANGDRTVSIVAPEPDETIHDNNGNLEVKVTVAPPLHTEKGELLTVLLDDEVVASGTRHHFKLTGIDRGDHTLLVQVTAADGKVLAASDKVTFHMWRASRLFPNRAR